MEDHAQLCNIHNTQAVPVPHINNANAHPIMKHCFHNYLAARGNARCEHHVNAGVLKVKLNEIHLNTIKNKSMLSVKKLLDHLYK